MKLTLNGYRALFLFTNVYAILDVKNSRANRGAHAQNEQPPVSEVNASESV